MSHERLVVLSGCSRGLGLELARALIGTGYRVVGLARTRSPEFENLCREAPELASFRKIDLAIMSDIYPVCRGIIVDLGTPYAVINNAAVGADGVLSTFHEKDISVTIATNLTGPILLTKYLTRPMLARREGRVINISSIVARTGFSGLSVYAATKAGLEGFSRSLSRELGKRAITVNCIAPGFMETDMTKSLGPQGLDSVRRRAPLGLAGPADVVPAALYLLGDAAKMITGTVITVDGGSTA